MSADDAYSNRVVGRYADQWQPIPHDHTEFIAGCFRCDLSRVELHDLDDVVAELGIEEDE